MMSVTFTELQRHAEEYFDAVEGGEEIEVRRNGEPVAIVSPHPIRTQGRWQRAQPVELKNGASLSRAILSERDSSS